MLKKVIFVLIIGSLAGCRSSKPSISTSRQPVGWKYSKTIQNGSAGNQTTGSNSTSTKPLSPNEGTKNYIAQYSAVAMNNMKTYGIPASIILAQGILESGAGKGDLALKANNHFGIKCHNDWTGDKTYKDDDAPNECFRKYKQASESYHDHAMLLTGKKRYAALFTLEKGNYKAWAKGLKEAGYATDPKYPEKLIAYIETYNLHQYDNKVLGKSVGTPLPGSIHDEEHAGHQGTMYEIQKGDTLYSVSKKYSMTVEELKQKNNLIDNTLAVGQRLIVK